MATKNDVTYITASVWAEMKKRVSYKVDIAVCLFVCLFFISTSNALRKMATPPTGAGISTIPVSSPTPPQIGVNLSTGTIEFQA